MQRIRALWGSTHPGPSIVVTTMSGALGFAAGLEPARLALLVVAVFAGQLSVGFCNDAVDAGRDRAVGRRDKPVVRGDVTPRAVMVAAVVTVALALVLSAPLGTGMLAAHALALASAWSYNAGLKSTAFSLVPFVVSFGLFPSFATLAAVPAGPAPGWAGVAGSALGAAVHLTNVLPDLDDDRRTGVRGLPHRLGARFSAILATAGVIGGAVAVLLGPAGGGISAIGPVSWVFFCLVSVVAVAALVRATTRPPDRAVFRLVMLASLLLAAQLVASGRALV